MDKIEITTDELYKHAKEQIDPTDAVQGIEIQADIILATLTSLAADVQNYGGSGQITLSQATQDGMAALNLFTTDSSVTAADITGAATSPKILPWLALKGTIRQLQVAYYAAKARLGLG